MKSRDILAFLALKHNGDREETYDAVRLKEHVLPSEASKLLENLGGKYITILDEDYPEVFKQIYKPPIVLFYKGDRSLLKSRKLLGIVGARKNSSYGEFVTKKIINELDEDFVIVSGLAKGIDSIAHKQALKRGMKTIAFLGCGINNIYPVENHQLYKDIEENGLILSEYPGRVSPNPHYFPFRNRLIAGLSKAVLVTDAETRSGSSTTISAAAAFGKNVYAVPHPITEENNSLCNEILQDGATMVLRGKDINEDF